MVLHEDAENKLGGKKFATRKCDNVPERKGNIKEIPCFQTGQIENNLHHTGLVTKLEGEVWGKLCRQKTLEYVDEIFRSGMKE